jgi:hypothetical protein
MMKILEAEGGAEAAARLAFPAIELEVTVLGDRRRGGAAGLHDENPRSRTMAERYQLPRSCVPPTTRRKNCGCSPSRGLGRWKDTMHEGARRHGRFPRGLLGRRHSRHPPLEVLAGAAGPTKTKRARIPFARYDARRRPATRSSHRAASSSSEAHVRSDPL